jgi:hypothetical protein
MISFFTEVGNGQFNYSYYKYKNKGRVSVPLTLIIAKIQKKNLEANLQHC